MSRAVAHSTALPRHYYVEGFGGWFVVHCSTQRIARSWGVREFGRGNVQNVRQATTNDLDSYVFWSRGGVRAMLAKLPLEDDPQ